MKNFLSRNKLFVIGMVMGAIAGFVYWKMIGCESGTCMITSKWHNSTVYGAIMGGLLFSLFNKEKNESTSKQS